MVLAKEMGKQNDQASPWMPSCRPLIRRKKCVNCEKLKKQKADKANRLWKMNTGREQLMQEEDKNPPLFMKVALPQEGSAILLSPEQRSDDKSIHNPTHNVEPTHICYAFSHHSVAKVRITHERE